MEKTENSEQIKFISTSGVYKTPFTLIMIIQFFVGTLIIIFVNLWYWNSLYFYIFDDIIFPLPILNDIVSKWIIILLIPLNIYGNMFLFVFSIITFSSLIYKLLNYLSPPKEGIFKRESKEWKYMHRRFWTAFFPIWLARALPIPWADIFAYRFFGTKVGKNVVLYEGYIDPLFVEIGDFTMTSLNICIFSHLIYHDKVLIRKVRIGDACVVGPQTITSPGTVMHDGAILGANSYTWIDQELESDLIHVGTPAMLKLPIQSVEESQMKVEKVKKGKDSVNEAIKMEGERK
ncbi:MAG: hypothetical protein P8Y23_04300 [Candidatus Lokiarchaeota archaeon]|jgi:hypothetical protein